MRILLGATIIFVISGATILAQDQITDPTTLDISNVAVMPRGDGILVPPLPSPTDDFSSPDFQPSFVSASFYTQSVPEPSTWALLGASLVLLLRKHKKPSNYSI